MSPAEDGGAVEAGLNLERLANSGHTPGPWQWVTSHDYGYSALWNPDTRAEVISTSGRNDSDNPITWMGEEMSEADAELISSAVGLLDLATQQAAEITRLRAEVERKDVTAKPLDWVKHPTANLWRAETIVGIYMVYAVVSPASWKLVTLSGEFEGTNPDAETAFASVLADYEQRIRSALGDQP